MELAEIVMNPVRQRIFQYLLLHETGTVKEIRKALPDVPGASLYRHMKLLTESGILTVVGENRIRGTVESIYSLNKSALEIDDDGTVVQTVMLPAGRTYVFSVYGRAAVTGLGEKPSFWLQAQKEDQTEIARHTENIRGNRGWKRMQLVFKSPSGSAPVKTRIVVRAVDMKGTMWLDGFQLEEGEAASRFNLMTYVDFSSGLDGFKKEGKSGDLDCMVKMSMN